MKKILTLTIAIAAAATVTNAALAADPIVTPFPAPQVVQLFVAAQTVTADGAVGNFFAPGAKVTFRAYAVDGKTHKVQVAKDVKYFYVTIPNQPNVKLTYNPTAPGATKRMAWTGTWTVPTTYPEGIVGFKMLVKSNAQRRGQFVQFPVSSSQLTISKSPPPGFTTGISKPAGTPDVGSLDVSLYVDSVNGTRPAAAAPRPIGCTQTNVYKRGEQFVLRSWGMDMATGDVLSSENVGSATAVIPGAPVLTLNWGAHGAATNRVWFWTNAWNIPTDYPLGEATIHVVFKTDAGKTGIFDYSITIIP